MLEQKLIVDRYLNLNVNPPPPPAFADGDIVLLPGYPCYLQESSGASKKTSTIQPGQFGPKLHRRFNWLPWVPGAIAETPLVGADVLTGPMSGCWLATYRKPNGVPHAVHLGTEDGQDQRNATVNGNWNAFAVAHQADIIGGFNPMRHWHGAFPNRKSNEPPQVPKFFGLFTVSGEYYILLCYVPQNSHNVLRIAGLQLYPGVTVVRLQHVDLAGP